MSDIMINGKSFTPDEVAVLAKADMLQLGQKHDPASTTLTAAPLNGPFHGNANQFGIFSVGNARPQRFAHVPRMGHVGALLPLMKTDLVNERFEILTGVTAAAGTNATNFCGNPPETPQLKTCAQTATFGELHFKTKLGDVTQTGQRRNRTDLPGELYNQAAVDNPLLPQVPGVDAIGPSMSLLRQEFYEAGVGAERAIAAVDYRGTAGTQNSTYWGVQKQWNGFDQLIKTGYADADNGLVCPAADSVVSAYNAEIDGTDTNGSDFVEAAHDVYYALQQRARCWHGWRRVGYRRAA